jgi:SnoaL-like domain
MHARNQFQNFHTEDSRTMNAVEVVRNNFNSWNRHDADAIAAAFAEGGVYITPSVPEPLTGAAIGDFAKVVWTIFPDFSLDLISIGDAGGGWSRFSGWRTAQTPAHSLTVLLPRVGKSGFREQASFRSRGIKFVRSKRILTG